MGKDTQLVGGLNEDQIQALKNKHGKLTLVTVENDIHFWFKKPNMETLAAAAKVSQKDEMEAAKVYFKNCLIKGDQSLIEDPEIFLAVAPHLEKLLEKKATTVKNF